MKINKKGFFLSETMVVISVVAVVLLGVFKLFNSVYFRFMETENYNTPNAINALSNIQKYYESIDNIDVSVITEDISYVDLTNAEKYESEYYTRLKEELNINSIYLMDLNKLNDLSKFHITLRKYLDTLRNEQGIILLISVNGNEFAYTEIVNYSTITLIGDEEDEYVVYVPVGDEFIDPGYTNWEDDEPVTYWENGKELDVNKPGTYYLHYDFNGKLFRRKVVVADFVTNFSYIGDYQVYSAFTTGYYKIELWGASGGDATYGGKGAYTAGVIRLNQGEKLYTYVGGTGIVSDNAATLTVGGYNGGGAALYQGGTGGGATDIRYFNSYEPSNNELLWDSSLGLSSRIMVAGGGGGYGVYSTDETGGMGGTLIADSGGDYSAEWAGAGTAGSQISGGNIGVGNGESYVGERAGGIGMFGIGGKGGYYPESPYAGAGAGGSGYYGGAGGSSRDGGGGGGSSFMSGYAGVNAITSSTDRTHTNNTLHYSNKYFIDGEMQAGVNNGNGKAKITFLGSTYEKKNSKLDNVRYIKDCINGNTTGSGNAWNELQAIKDGVNIAYGKNITGTGPLHSSSYTYESVLDADITNEIVNAYVSVSGAYCITVDLEQNYNLDEIAVWHHWQKGPRSYNNHSLYVSSDNSNWITLIDNVSGVVETANGIRVSAYD